MDAADQHAAALAIVHEEAGRTLSKADFDLCMRISKRALARSDAAQAPEAAAYLVTGLNECNEEWASAWIKRGNADAAAARLYRGAVTPLYAAPVAAAAAPGEWQPIETVPKDGTEVALLFAADIEILGEIRPRVRAASWRGDWSIPYSRNNPPTHWAHLPAAPQGAAQ